VTLTRNVDQLTGDAFKQKIENNKYGQSADFFSTLTPVDPRAEVSIDVMIGKISRSLYLPPLVVQN
jgi:hypothetical protein